MTSSAQVWVDTIQGEPHQGYKLEGRRFGELTVMRAVDRRETNILWVCRCDCGRVALRTSGQLMYSEKRHSEPMCRVCLEELRGGMFAEARAQNTQNFVEYYARFGSLYSLSFSEQFREEMIEELEEHEIPRPTEEAFDASVVVQPPYSRSSPEKGQRAAYLAPLSGRLWQCSCSEYFNVGLACLACKEPVCRACVQQEQHVCDRAKRAVWEETMVPRELLEVEEKGVPFKKKTSIEEQIQALKTARLEEALKKKLEEQRLRKAVKAAEERDRKEKERQQRHRSIRKKYPWLAEEMGLTKKASPPVAVRLPEQGLKSLSFCWLCRIQVTDLGEHRIKAHGLRSW